LDYFEMAYTWDPVKRRFIDENGKTVRSDTLRKWVDDTTLAIGLYFILLSQRVQSGEITMSEWAAQMRADLTAMHLAMTAVAFGGDEQVDEDGWSYASQVILTQQGYFNNFHADYVFSGKEIDDSAVARTAMYAAAGYLTFENAVALRESKAGMTLYRRNTAGGEVCPECVDYAARGWQPIGTLPPIGTSSRCMVRCRCWFSYRTGTMADVAAEQAKAA
jgi:hypothetical protein